MHFFKRYRNLIIIEEICAATKKLKEKQIFFRHYLTSSERQTQISKMTETKQYRTEISLEPK